MSKRKFTLYQASRFTKISRYKLEQAIQDNLLKTMDGKGNVKCYILEDDLNKFLDNHGEQYKRFTYPDDNKSPFVSSEINDFISIKIHDEIIEQKNRIIKLLEDQNNENVSKVSFYELKSVAEKALNELPESKRNIKDDLNNQLKSIN